MWKKILIAVLVLYGVFAISSHINDKVTRKYFMPLIKFKDLVVDDNLSEREEKYGFKSKIWLHHVDNAEKLAKHFNEYEGFEMDVFYNASRKTFVVDHNDENGEITLDDMFSKMPDMSNKFFWIDLKNIDFENKNAVLKEMIAVIGRNIIHKSHLIIESTNPEYLDGFAENGFLTSFYFPSLNRVKREDIRFTLEKATEKYKNSTVDFISGDVRYFNYIDYYFRDVPKMYWNIGREAKNINPFILSRSDTVVVLNEDAKSAKK